LSPTFHSLRIRDYRLFWSGMAVSNIGTWMQRVAQDWLVLQLSGGSAAVLGITTGLQFLPLLLVTPLGGVLADRFSKLKLLRITQACLAVLALTQGVLTLTGVIEVWQVYLLALGLGIVNALDNPARQSFVSELVPIGDLANAVSLNSVSFQSARIVGPALAGVLITMVGTGWVFVLNAVTFFGPLITLFMLSGLGVHRPRNRGTGGLGDGLLYIRGRRDIVLVLSVLFFVGTFGFNFQMTSALMATEVFGQGAGQYGVLGSIMAIGSVTGSLIAARRGQVGYRSVLAAAVAFASLEVVAGLMPSFTTYALALIPMGVAGLMFMTSANSYIQTTVLPEMRGRVMSIYLMVFMGGTPVGAPLIGWVGERFGARWTVSGGGAMVLLGIVLVVVVLGRHGEVSVRPALPRRWRRAERPGVWQAPQHG